MLTRKTYTPNYLNHKVKRNKGDKDQHRRKDHHDSIVTRDGYIAVALDDFSTDFDSLEADFGSFMDTCKEVRNIAVGTSSFTVTYSDGSMATFNYSVDRDGRMTGITRVV